MYYMKRKNNYIRLWLAVVALCLQLVFPVRTLAEWNPFVMNFDKKILGRSLQTWQIAPFGDRWIYFANRGGMLQFDGSTWEHYSLHNRSEVRAVYPSANFGRIYVGGINEYGYYAPAPDGTLRYTCLSDSLPAEYRELGNVWGIHENDNILYFQGDGRVVKGVNGKYTLIEAPGKINCSHLVNGILYIGTTEGVCFLVGNTFFPLNGGEALKAYRICGIAPFRGGLLIATALNGLFYSDGRTVTPFVTGAEHFMADNEVYCLAVRGEQIAVGTIRHGIVWIDAATGQQRYLNEDTGMQDNTVLSLAFDSVGNLWAGLDAGIDYLWMNAPLTNLYTRNHFFGTGYAAAVAGPDLFLGTNRGLYVMSHPLSHDSRPLDIALVPASSGQVWDLCPVGDELFCAHDRGLFLVRDRSLSRVSDLQGVWTCQPVKGHPDVMFVGAYDGLYVYVRTEGRWKASHKVEGIKDSFHYFRQQTDRVIWLVQDEVIHRFELTADYRRLQSGRVEAALPAGMDTLFAAPLLRQAMTHPVAQLFTPVGNIPMMIPVSDGRFVIPHEDGFALYTPQDTLYTARKPHLFRIKRMYVTTPRDSLVYTDNFLDHKCVPHLDYAGNSVRFEFTLLDPSLVQGIHFRYRLNGGAWSELTGTDRKEYSNLREGHYTFEVQTVLPGGEQDTDSLSFTIRPPWYRSLVAWIVYALLLAGLVRKAFRWDARRMQRKQQMAVAQKDLEMAVVTRQFQQEQVRHEEQISQLEREKLEYELQHKSQEMMNLMIGMKRKNEVLGEIKADLLKVVSAMKGESAREAKQQLLVINTRIDENMQSDDVLSRIEEQFDLLHNDFMKRLHQRFPDLSNNEYMMCAYLKMELSTKEMAPLLGISVRGVETLRYRLRKKLGLEREEGILEFLNQL
jgi:DNA-binding CsgD family transcriptional regulator